MIDTCDICGLAIIPGGLSAVDGHHEECLNELEDRWLDRHSVNCLVCNRLFDERESIGHDWDGAGELCRDHPSCECEEGPRYRQLQCEDHGFECPMWVCVVCGFGFEFPQEDK